MCSSGAGTGNSGTAAEMENDVKALKWNGEFWYEDRTPLWNRIATPERL